MLVGFLAVLMLAACANVAAAESASKQLLVTFASTDARHRSAGFRAPYRARKRYAVAESVRQDARAIAREYALIEVDQWPIKSLDIHCYVFALDESAPPDVLTALGSDPRVESVQWLSTFRTLASGADTYDDTYVAMQHGIETIELTAAHRVSRGEGVRVAVIDSDADHRHEDLRGSIKRSHHLDSKHKERDRQHGTAVASIIAAQSNNAVGIVGVAPGAKLEVSEACWRDPASEQAICDTFSLAKALDSLFDEPPDIVNLSLAGPTDPLLQRIIVRLLERGAVIIAAAPGSPDRAFPASMQDVIAVATIGEDAATLPKQTVYAPGNRILVAVPHDDYEFKSGASLAAAHVSGIAALLKSRSPDSGSADIQALLLRSQHQSGEESLAVNACHAIALLQPGTACD